MFIVEKIKEGVNKGKDYVKTHKSGIIKKGAIVGGTALGLGVLGYVANHFGSDYIDGEYSEEFEKVDFLDNDLAGDSETDETSEKEEE